MPEIQAVDDAVAKSVPQVNAPSNNRMIIAFPFSAVRISHSDETVSRLAELLAELAEYVAESATDPDGRRLAERARVLAQQVAQGSDS
jgi:hypothetical protein